MNCEFSILGADCSKKAVYFVIDDSNNNLEYFPVSCLCSKHAEILKPFTKLKRIDEDE